MLNLLIRRVMFNAFSTMLKLGAVEVRTEVAELSKDSKLNGKQTILLIGFPPVLIISPKVQQYFPPRPHRCAHQQSNHLDGLKN